MSLDLAINPPTAPRNSLINRGFYGERIFLTINIAPVSTFLFHSFRSLRGDYRATLT
jgi:hypothetical protein